jgi:hypothetical protein
MTINGIQAIGNLLQYYHSDLTYIFEFHKCKTGEFDFNDYLKKNPGTFRSFINEFKIARNVDKTKTRELLEQTFEWINNEDPNDIDSFAEHLKLNGITHGKKVTSLASKILFLNNPWKILPIDRLGKKAANLSENNYSKYQILIKEFRENKKTEIENYLNSVDQHLNLIESDFERKIRDLKIIRENRFIDKLLWTIGINK